MAELLISALPNLAFADERALECGALVKANAGKETAFEVDRVWSGTRVQFSGVSTGSKVLAGYYDRDRWFTVAELDFQNNRECRTRLPSRFAGWDSHNEVALALASDGSLHVAGNMHVSPLVYARAEGGRLDRLEPGAMVGKDEDFVTYPTFLKAADGSLAFIYRTGRSGDGDWLMNRYSAGKWSRVGQLFAGTDAKGTLSAYPTDFVRDAEGWYHVAIVWRRTYNVATNFAITYARTRDFQNWEAADGRKLKAPLSPDDADVIERPGENAGLLNNAHLLLSSKMPVVLYTRYADEKSNGIFAARPDHGHWLVTMLSQSKTLTTLKGGGSLADVPKVGGDQDISHVSFRFPGEPLQRVALDPETLRIVGPAAPSAAHGVALPQPAAGDIEGLADAASTAAAVTDADDKTRVVGHLAWFAQAPNRDKPRECKPPAVRACDPPPARLLYLPGT